MGHVRGGIDIQGARGLDRDVALRPGVAHRKRARRCGGKPQDAAGIHRDVLRDGRGIDGNSVGVQDEDVVVYKRHVAAAPARDCVPCAAASGVAGRGKRICAQG